MASAVVEPNFFVQKGVEVEVSSDEEGFKGAWYRATVEEILIRDKCRKVLIKYATLINDDGSTPLMELVDVAYIRPLPPEEKENGGIFKINDVVDAVYCDGWWTGVVRKALENFRYRVYFDDPPDVIEFEGKDLRMHFDWIDGKWVRPVKQQSTSSLFGSGTTVEVILEKDNVCDLVPAIVIKENADDTFFVKYLSWRDGYDTKDVKVTVDSRHIRPTPPSFKDKEYDLLEHVDTVYESGWREGKITKLLSGKRYTVYFEKQGKEKREFDHSDLRPHLEWINGQWEKKSKMQESLVVQNHQKQFGPINTRVDSTQTFVQAEKIPHASQNKTEERTPSTHIRKKWADRSNPLNESYVLPLAKKIKFTMSGGSKQSTPVKKQNGENASDTQVIVKCRPKKITEKTLLKKAAPHGLAALKAKGTRTQASVSPGNNDQPSVVRGRGRPPKFVSPQLPQAVDQDALDEKLAGSSGSDSGTIKIDKSVTEAPNSVPGDDHLLSTWIEGNRSSGTGEIRVSSLRTANAAEKQTGMCIECPMRDELQVLPFAKSSLVWKTVESLEVFRIFPQRPHFHPLIESKEEHREGTAIGIMVTFASLCEKITSLQFNDPRTIFDSITDSLLELEKHGFDVTVPQNRINMLLSIKDREGQILDESRDVEKQIMELDISKGVFEEAMEENRKKIAELQKQLTSVESLRDGVETEMVRLKSHGETLDAQCRNARSEFQNAVNAPWKPT